MRNRRSARVSSVYQEENGSVEGTGSVTIRVDDSLVGTGSGRPDDAQPDQPLAFISPTRGASESQNSSRASNCVSTGSPYNDWGTSNVLENSERRHKGNSIKRTVLLGLGTMQLRAHESLSAEAVRDKAQ